MTDTTGVSYLDWTPAGELVSLTRPGEGIATLTRARPDSAWSAVTQGTAGRAVSADIYGSTLDTVLAAGSTYDVYGKAASPTSKTVSVGYRGEIAIDGLTFLRARSYDPGTGAFTTVDPINPIPGTPGANYYTYVNNSPLNYTDPTGLFSVTGALRTGAEVYSGYSAAKLAVDFVRDPAGTVRDLKHQASKAVGWVVDHKDFIITTVAGIAAYSACVGISAAFTLGFGALGCTAVAGAVSGMVGGALSSCGDGHTAGQCFMGVIAGGVVGAVTAVAFYGAGKLVGTLGRAAASRIASSKAGQATSRFLAREAAEVATDAAENTARETAETTIQKAATPREPQLVYRGGSRTPDNLTPRPGKDPTGLSTFDNPAAAAPNGGKVQVIDTSKLKCTIACPDAPPPGHVSIRPPDSSQIPGWAGTRGTGEVHPLTQDVLDAIVDEIRLPKR